MCFVGVSLVYTEKWNYCIFKSETICIISVMLLNETIHVISVILLSETLHIISVMLLSETIHVISVVLLSETSTGIDADASKGETSPGYFNSKLVYSYKCGTIFP